ncbi:MAG: hypothetical protein EXR47_07460 [Dehalococcoidia bacterium]|nr:hypothetical protein [Dehalococcoidia bacterium]
MTTPAQPKRGSQSDGINFVCSVHGCATTSRNLFRVNAPEGPAFQCLRHLLMFRPLLRRSLLTALVVGTILTAINQSGPIVRGDVPLSLIGRIVLTYCVPFCVTTWGALINTRVRVPGAGGRSS